MDIPQAGWIFVDEILASAKVMETSAIFSGLRVSVPLKTTSVILEQRNAVGRCSPRTQRIASETLLLPHPFGPTIEIMPGSNWRRVLSAKLLKPVMSICLRYTSKSLSWAITCCTMERGYF
jgi:hypothetical protein